MKISARLGWLAAVLLALSLIAPFSTPAAAMQTDAGEASQTATSESTTASSETDSEDPAASLQEGDGSVDGTSDGTGDPLIEVDPPILFDLPIFKTDSVTNALLGGAGFTLYTGACPASGSPIGAEQFTGASDASDGSAGRTIFTGLVEGTYCVVETTAPTGYSGGGSATIAMPDGASGWTFQNDPIPVETYDLPIFKVDSGTNALLGGAGFTVYSGACPGGAVAAAEQFTGPGNAVDGSAGRTIFTGLVAGDYCVVETTAPSGYSGGGSATISLPDNVSGWTFGNDPLAADTYDLPIFKTDSVSGALLGGAGFTLYGDACPASGNPIGGEQFTGASDASDGSAGRTIFSGLAEGTYCVVETTPPTGYSGGGSATISLPENVSGWTFQNDPLPVKTYDLPIFKEDSDTGAKLGGAGFTLYAGACPASGTGSVQQFTGNADAIDGSAGRTIFTDLPAGTYCVVETTVPAGYVGGGSQTLSLPDDASGWTFLNDPISDTGTLSLLKYFCAVDDPDAAGIFFDLGANGYDCHFGAASFYLWPTSSPTDVYGPISTGSETGAVSVDLPAGNYMLEEIGSGAQRAFTITRDQTTSISVWNMIYDEGSLYVTKIYCKSKFDMTDVTFDYPDSVDAASWNWGHKPKCWQGNANFEVWLYGDPNNVIVFQTGADGEVWLTLPETTDATGMHKLVETDTGTWAWFGITRGEITFATVTNYFEWHHPQPQPLEPTIPVTTLPKTGSGSTGNDAWFLLGMMVAGMAGLGGMAMRRKLASR